MNQTCEAKPLEKVKCTSHMKVMDVSLKYQMLLNFGQLEMYGVFESLWQGKIMKSLPM